jgi:transcriptional regulator with XRE-family HTH domain
MSQCASDLRKMRTRLGLSQEECATALGVAVETFRTWDAGRRLAPEAIVRQARTLKAKRPQHDPVPLQVLADELHVHVRTLRRGACQKSVRDCTHTGCPFLSAGSVQFDADKTGAS